MRISSNEQRSVLIDWIQDAFLRNAALVINPADFSFGRIPALDVVKLIRRPVVELHITNIHPRSEEYRHSTMWRPLWPCGNLRYREWIPAGDPRD